MVNAGIKFNSTDIQEKIVLNFNLDMLNCQDESELYLCGTKYQPEFKRILNPLVKKMHLNFGHDEESIEKKSWVNSSDHREFHNRGIPFIYFGSENETYYNTPEDDFENINIECFVKTLEMTKKMIIELDGNL